MECTLRGVTLPEKPAAKPNPIVAQTIRKQKAPQVAGLFKLF